MAIPVPGTSSTSTGVLGTYAYYWSTPLLFTFFSYRSPGTM